MTQCHAFFEIIPAKNTKLVLKLGTLYERSDLFVFHDLIV